jgi:hypothetical protein
MCPKPYIENIYGEPRSRTIILVAAALFSTSCLGQQPSGASTSFAPAGPPLLLASDSDESASIAVEPALRGGLAPRTQPAPTEVPKPFLGPRNDIAIFTAGNLNPASNIFIQNTPHLAVSSNKSSLGGSAEYRRWFSNRTALGLLYTQNPSDGKLLWQGQNYIWPQMRWDLSILATRSFKARSVAPFICAGPGIVLTNGYANSGWSAGFALVGGFGTDVQISRRFSARTGIAFLDTKNGCYDDPTCRETRSVVEDLRVGIAYNWGREKISDHTR